MTGTDPNGPPPPSSFEPPLPPPPHTRRAQLPVSDPNLSEPPLEDPTFSGSIFAALIATASRVLFAPGRFFAGMREDRSVIPSLIWVFLILCFAGFLQLVSSHLSQSDLQQLFDMLEGVFPGKIGSNVTEFESIFRTYETIILALTPVIVAIQFLVFVFVFFISAMVWDAFRPRFSMFIRVCAFAQSPQIIGAAISVLQILVFLAFPLEIAVILNFPMGILQLVVPIYSLVLFAVGLRRAGGASPPRAFGATITPLALCCVCCCLLGLGTMFLLSGMMAGAG